MVIDRSAEEDGCLTEVVSVAELLPELGSDVSAETEAVLEMSATREGSTWTTRVSVSLAPLASAPIDQVTVPKDRLPPLSAETKEVPAGSGSLTVTPVASEGPLLLTPIV